MPKWIIRFFKPIRDRAWTLFALFCLVMAIPLALYLSTSNHRAPVGVLVGIMGLVAAGITFREKPEKAEKAIWILLMTLLFFAEVRNLYVADAEQTTKFTEETKKLEKISGDLTVAISGINTATSNSQAQLDTSKEQFTAAMNKTNALLALSEESMKNITGGNSFAYVSPQNFSGDQFPGLVWNNGEQALSGLTLTIAHTSDPDWGQAFFRPIFIGTIGPHEHAPIPGFLFQPRTTDKTGQDNYWIMLSAQNGTVSQSLYFRRDRRNPANWAYSFQVSKQTLLDKPQTQKIMLKGNPVPKGTKVTTYKLLLYRGWSDELADTPAKP